MKKYVCLLIVVSSMAFFTGCASVASPVSGLIFMDVKAPLTATNATESKKMGTAMASTILGLFATGDASIETAAKNGKITKIQHVDYHSTNILGIYSTYTVEVYGD